MNWEEYITDEEKREIAKEVFREEFKKEIREDITLSRFISNVGYKMIFNMIDDQLNINSKQLVADKVKELLEKEMTTFLVFKTKDQYGQQNSVAQQILEDTVKENQHLIKKRVKEVLLNTEEDKVYSIVENIQLNATEKFVNTLLGG